MRLKRAVLELRKRLLQTMGRSRLNPNDPVRPQAMSYAFAAPIFLLSSSYPDVFCTHSQS
ncbi:hypothetical protein SAMN05877838_2670 [Hoeflea halophila]|uniref:Uncharacterized protein n=1 Tax=Hoeflea halophila TaxID=714899 RepID=A0A286ICN4_9HYPH|nr:hypothetical protein SAMN05877838_2670 [Hoeflea halophila]